MIYTITIEDINLLYSYSHIDLKVLLLNNNLVQIGEISGDILSLSLNIDADSSIRRTASLSISPREYYSIDENSKVWTDKKNSIVA